MGWWCDWVVVQGVASVQWVCWCVCVCGKRKRKPGSSRAIGGRALTGQDDPTTSSRIPAKVRSVVGGGRGGRELANRGAVVNAVASRRFCSKPSRAPAREKERGGRKRGRRVEPRTDHADLTRCPTTASTQRYCPSCNARVHCKAHAVIRCRSWRQRANDRTMRKVESPEKKLRRQAAHAMTIIGV